ncbi:MAG: ribonuclease, partial [Marinobacterium sp.]
IILLGAELTRLLTVSRLSKFRRNEPHLYTLLGVLHRLWQAQQTGEPVPDRVLLQEVEGLDQGRWDDYVQLLLDAGLVRRTEGGQYLLSRDLSRYTLLDLQRALPWPLPEPYELQEQPWQQDLHERLEQLRGYRGEVLDVTLQQLYQQTPAKQPQE